MPDAVVTWGRGGGLGLGFASWEGEGGWGVGFRVQGCRISENGSGVRELGFKEIKLRV